MVKDPCLGKETPYLSKLQQCGLPSEGFLIDFFKLNLNLIVIKRPYTKHDQRPKPKECIYTLFAKTLVRNLNVLKNFLIVSSF